MFSILKKCLAQLSKKKVQKHWLFDVQFYTKKMFSILKKCLEIHVSMVWDMQCFLRLLHLTISEIAGFRNPPVLGHIDSVTSGGLEGNGDLLLGCRRHAGRRSRVLLSRCPGADADTCRHT